MARITPWLTIVRGRLNSARPRREGSSGASFARREIDCQGERFLYLDEGEARVEAERHMSLRRKRGLWLVWKGKRHMEQTRVNRHGAHLS